MDLHAFEETIKAHIKQAGLSQAAVARQLNYAPDQFNKWIKGVNRMPDTTLREICDLLELSTQEQLNLFTLAGYKALILPNDEAAPAHPSGNLFINALKDWNDSVFRWSAATPHMRSSWAGWLIHAMAALTDRVTARGLFILSISLLLWLAADYLMRPILQWPLAEAEARWDACLKYGLATWLMPLFIACVTPPDRAGLFELKTPRQQGIFWLLKLTGALVGFWVFSVGVIGVALTWYYLFLAPLPVFLQIILPAIPLFMGYVTARRIPVDRHKMFNRKLQAHPADWLFLGVFIFVGPLLALFLYAFHWFLADRTIAPIALLVILAAVALWEYRKSNTALPKPLLILVYGLFIPALVLLYAFFLTPTLPPPSADERPYLLLISVYVLGWTLFIATLMVQGRATLTLSGSFSLLALLLLANLLVTIQRWLGAGFILILGGIWALWGRRRFRHYFWVHASFWVMLVGTLFCLYLLRAGFIPLWASGLSFSLIALISISWAYRHQEAAPQDYAEAPGR